MSQYDLIDLWVTHMDFLMVLFVSFISATSAFLVVANVKGRELQQGAYRLIVYLYFVASLFFLAFMAKVSEGIFNLRGQMHEANMDWYNVVYEPQFILPIILIAGLLIMISLVAGSLWYFASVRRNPAS